MASAIPNSFKKILLDILATYDVRVKLLMSNTTCDTEVDAIDNVSDYTTVDVSDDSTYADYTILGESVAVDDLNNRAEFDVTDFSFTGLTGDATRDYVGVLFIKYVDGTDANDVPLFYHEFPATKPKESTAVNVTVNTETLLQLT